MPCASRTINRFVVKTAESRNVLYAATARSSGTSSAMTSSGIGHSSTKVHDVIAATDASIPYSIDAVRHGSTGRDPRGRCTAARVEVGTDIRTSAASADGLEHDGISRAPPRTHPPSGCAVHDSSARAGCRRPHRRCPSRRASPQYVRDHHRSPIAVADIAASVHLTPSHAMTVFRRTAGVTLSDYVTMCRVAEAQR